ncbi:hypothetical protein D9619_011218 [Psilocybe cf. subviscida]|uniref:MYND-type domain-containing protein n=1 Tax=Psilocybe cf. subviscida TaxID=2480587 RepID=A0A8H5BJ02_9AGAR|nr:hypothetical protein D9619_011218 [Psilocybe cf. subviscida]
MDDHTFTRMAAMLKNGEGMRDSPDDSAVQSGRSPEILIRPSEEEAPPGYVELPPPTPELLDLIPTRPPPTVVDDHILSPEALIMKLVYTMATHRHYAMRCPLDCHKRIVSKRTLREMRLAQRDTCAVCMRHDSKEGSLLKNCARCKLIKYCSTECQRKGWSDHKAICNRDNGKGMLQLIKTALSNPFILHEVIICLALVSKLDKDLPLSQRLDLASKPRVVRMDVGIEPTDIVNTDSIFRHRDNWNFESVEGMLQINNIHESPTGHDIPKTGQRRDAYPFWKDLRAQLDRRGMQDFPIVFLEVTNKSIQVATYILPIFAKSIAGSEQRPAYTVRALPTHRERPTEVDLIEHRMNHINEHIRCDVKNKFLLRTPMAQRDKDIILAGFKGMAAEQYSGGMWYLKFLGEPVYEVIRVLGRQDFYIDVANKVAGGKNDEAVELMRDSLATMGYRLVGV